LAQCKLTVSGKVASWRRETEGEGEKRHMVSLVRREREALVGLCANAFTGSEKTEKRSHCLAWRAVAKSINSPHREPVGNGQTIDARNTTKA